MGDIVWAPNEWCDKGGTVHVKQTQNDAFGMSKAPNVKKGQDETDMNTKKNQYGVEPCNKGKHNTSSRTNWIHENLYKREAQELGLEKLSTKTLTYESLP